MTTTSRRMWPAMALSFLGLSTVVGSLALRGNSSTITPRFNLSVAPANQSVSQGGSATYTITLIGKGDFAGAVALQTDNLPDGVSGTMSPNAVSVSRNNTVRTASLTISVSAQARTGEREFQVVGRSGKLNDAASVRLTITTGPGGGGGGNGGATPFTISGTPSGTLKPGGTVKLTHTASVTGSTPITFHT
jgi:hypothetical protein